MTIAKNIFSNRSFFVSLLIFLLKFSIFLPFRASIIPPSLFSSDQSFSPVSFHHSAVFRFSHALSFASPLHLFERSSPSPLLVSNIILGSLLTLSSFTRFSLYCLHSPSRILLPILTLLPPGLSSCRLPLFSILSRSVTPSCTLPEAILHPSPRYHVNPSLLPTSPHFASPHCRQRQTNGGDEREPDWWRL